MNTKLANISEMSKLMSEKNSINRDLMSLFGRFKIGRMLSRLSLEKARGISAVDLLIGLCLFRINGESIHSVYRKRFYDLLDTGKNCYYRMMSRRTMNWRSLLTCMVKRFCGIIREEDAVEKDVPSCYIIDDTTIEKTGSHIEQISKVFDHVKGKCVTGFKLLLLAYFDGRTTIPCDFSLNKEKGKSGTCGFDKKTLGKQFHKKRTEGTPAEERVKEAGCSKIKTAVSMMKRAWKNGIKASYALMDSWFVCEEMISSVRSIGRGAVHLIGLAKINKTKYMLNGKKLHPSEIIAAMQRKHQKTCRKYKCAYIRVDALWGNEPVRLFLIHYGHREKWNLLVTTDMTMDFVKAFELYQIRWNIEVLNKECKQYLGLGKCQCRDFDSQIADATLCFITHIVLSLDKRFSEYETMGELFASRRDELLALTLWQRILPLIARMLEVIADMTDFTVDEMLQKMMNDERTAKIYGLWLNAVEQYDTEQKDAA